MNAKEIEVGEGLERLMAEWEEHVAGCKESNSAYTQTDGAAVRRCLRELRAALRERHTEGQAVGWREMDSAPRDGTRILVAGDDDGGRIVGGVVEARWFNEPAHRNEGWLAYFDDPAYDPGCYICPTHWMPLPSPPIRTSGGGK